MKKLVVGFVLMLPVCLYILSCSRLLGMAGGSGGVEIVESSQVGIYDTQVIKSTDSAALINWLSENGFAFPLEVKPVLDNYIFSIYNFEVGEKWS